MLYHMEFPVSGRPRHDWTRFKAMLSWLPAGETLVVMFKDEGKHWPILAQQAVYRYKSSSPEDQTLVTARVGKTLHVTKVKDDGLPVQRRLL